jgi:multidrug efflux system membrane fusion protein
MQQVKPMNTNRGTTLVRFVLVMVLMTLSFQLRAEELPASLDWAELHYASVPVEGFVDAVLVQVGQRVNKGDKLLQLDTTVLSARVKQARADVASLQPTLADAKRAYHDAQSLYEQTVLADVELQKAKMAFDIASAKLNAAEAMLAVNTAKLARATQYAPWAGWVIERHLESGQVIAGDVRSQPLIVLARADEMVAEAYVSAENRSHLVVGQSLKVRYQNKVYPGKIQSMDVMPRSKTDNSYAVRVVFQVDPAVMLRPGESASLVLP